MSTRDGAIGPDGRKRKSGSEYKKEREKKKAKEEEVTDKMKKISSFFSPEASAGKLEYLNDF